MRCSIASLQRGGEAMAGRKLHYGWVVIFTALLVMIGKSFGSFDDIIPDMRSSLDLSYSTMGLLTAAHQLGYSLMVIVGGVLAAKFGARIVIALALTIAGIAMTLTGFAQTFEFAVAMGGLAGLGIGAVFLPALTLGSAWFATTRRGLATGIIAAGTVGGTMIASSLIPVIITAYTGAWRFAWYYQGAAVLIIAGLAALLIRSLPEDIGLRPVGALEQAATKQPGTAVSLPLHWRKVYRTKAVWYLGLVYFWYGFVQYIFGQIFWTSHYWREIGAGGTQDLWLWRVVSIFGGVVWGAISDKIGRGTAAAAVYAALLISCAIFTVPQVSWGFYPRTIIFGLTTSSILTIMAATAGDYAGPRLAPALLAFITVFLPIGDFIVIWTMLHFGLSFYGQSTAAVLLLCGLSLVGAVLSLGMNRIRYEES